MTERQWYWVWFGDTPQPIHTTQEFIEKLSPRIRLEPVQDGRFLERWQELVENMGKEGQLEAQCSILEEIRRG